MSDPITVVIVLSIFIILLGLIGLALVHTIIEQDRLIKELKDDIHFLTYH